MADRQSQLLKPRLGTLSKEVERLTSSIINELSNLDNVGIDDYLLMASTDPIVGAGIEVPMLMGSQKLGYFHHPDPDIQSWMLGNFTSMQGSLQLSFAEMWGICKITGNSFSEISSEFKNGEWRLESLLAVDPRYFRYAGSIGKITTVRYRTSPEGLINIPYEKGIHIVNGRHLNIGRDPYGFSECKKAYPYWKAKKLVLAAMLIATQRQATPLLVGRTDLESSFELVDSYGNILLGDDGLPIRGRAGDRMKSALEQIENQSVMVIDRNMDEIIAIAQQTDGAFFLNVLRFLNSQILMAFLMPETVVTTGSQGASGDSNLNEGHGAILGLVVSSFTQQIKERLIEDICRFYIFNKFGEQETYGEFKEPEQDKTDSVALLGAIANAATSGVLGGTDIEVINRSRDLARIPPIDQILIQQASRYSNMDLEDTDS
jgi:hypothetical protein